MAAASVQAQAGKSGTLLRSAATSIGAGTGKSEMLERDTLRPPVARAMRAKRSGSGRESLQAGPPRSHAKSKRVGGAAPTRALAE